MILVSSSWIRLGTLSFWLPIFLDVFESVFEPLITFNYPSWPKLYEIVILSIRMPEDPPNPDEIQNRSHRDPRDSKMKEDIESKSYPNRR